MTYDIAIVGAGIAGASLAAELALHRSVVLIEAETTPGYHSTGRSAAFWHETLGGPLVQPLTTWSRETLERGGFLKPRLSLNVVTAGNEPLLDALEAKFAASGVRLSRLDAAGIKTLVPRANGTMVGGVVEEDCADIDVAGLHAAAIKSFAVAGGMLRTGFRVDAVVRREGNWTLSAGDETIDAALIVNAAGAWADEFAALCGAVPLGIEPRRRTIAQVRVDGDDVRPDGPLTIDLAGTFYFKPEAADRLWLCPHDETPTPACDAAPEELDIAIAIDRFEAMTDWRVKSVERKWAGLRSFAPDRLPVFGFDGAVLEFFWCAGQGGIGIQTAPAAARLCAHLILGDTVPLPDALVPHSFTPLRFA